MGAGEPVKNSVVEVNRAAPGETRLVEAELEPLTEGQVRLHIDRLALTANNITYAVMGDMLGYWDFFPTGEVGWGRVPAMGWGDVVESAHPEVETGGRYYGWFPMAGYVDLVVSPSEDGVRDNGAHRQAHAPIYRSYVETSRDPLYPTSARDSDRLGEAEDRHALLRGLYLTGFLIDAFFDDEHYLGAEAAVVLSASSKTAISFAQIAAERDIAVVGVTSSGNADFARSLGWYDEVIVYDDIDSLPVVPTVSVDMSGNGGALAALHARLGDRLAHSMIVGKSHHDSPMAEISTGPSPQLFFAPTEVSRRLEQWGREEYQRRSAEALESFVAGSERWLTVERTTGASATQATWHEVFDSAVPPSIGRIVSLHD